MRCRCRSAEIITGLIAMLFAFCVIVFWVIPAHAKTDLPAGAIKYLPVLKTEIQTIWPDVQPYSTLGALIEQESCISLKHKKCWNPRAELKTDREYGFGLGQLTVTHKFNAFEEVKAMHPSMRDWRWEDRYNPSYQLRAIVLKNRNNFRAVSKWTPRNEDRMAFTFSAYNGGLGGLMKDRRLCANVKGCDTTRWFGHVEQHSFRSKVAVKGYGQSFFDINRGYVRNVWNETPRRKKYIPYLDQNAGL